VTRAERATTAAALRDQGLNGVEIAQRMQISRAYTYELITDPAGEQVRKRKASYRGQCVDCGRATHGCAGPGHAPKRCVLHAARHLAAVASIPKFAGVMNGRFESRQCGRPD